MDKMGVVYAASGMRAYEQGLRRGRELERKTIVAAIHDYITLGGPLSEFSTAGEKDMYELGVLQGIAVVNQRILKYDSGKALEHYGFRKVKAS